MSNVPPVLETFGGSAARAHFQGRDGFGGKNKRTATVGESNRVVVILE